MRATLSIVLLAALSGFLLSCSAKDFGAAHTAQQEYEHGLSDTDIRFLSGFSLSALAALPVSSSNRYADNLAAAKLGQQIFFDSRFSSNGKVSCASCHQPQRYFTDGRERGEGIGVTLRNTPSLLGVAYGPWKYWDGRKDSLWAQALEPLEKSNEHNISRQKVSELVQRFYAKEYTEVFSNSDETTKALNSKEQDTAVFVNLGKALMAYQRRLTLQAAKFDRFIDELAQGQALSDTNRLSAAELAGLRLFMGKASCASCHNGPLFTNFEFHNIGAPEPDQSRVDLGRHSAIELLRNDEFNCLSSWSDAKKSQCEELQYLKTQGPELVGAFKTPSLRNVTATAPYMQAGQLATLQAVIEHYNAPKPPFYDRQQHPNRPHFDVLPLGLTEQEKGELLSFLATLQSPINPDDRWWQAP